MSPGRHLLVAAICSVAGLADVATLASVAGRAWAPPATPAPAPVVLAPVVVAVPVPPPVPPEAIEVQVEAVVVPAPEPPEPEGPLVVINFESEAIELSAGARAALAALAAAREGGELRIEGHADPSGRAEGNAYFARARARVVAGELERLGMPRASMEVVGLGASRPLEGARTPAARARNRRVEVWRAAAVL